MALKLTTYSTGDSIPLLPGNNTFHSPALFHLYEETPGYMPLLTVAWLDGEIAAYMLAVVHRERHTFFPSVSRRCQVYGSGEYLVEGREEREQLFSKMLQLLTKEAHKRCYIIEFRNLEHPLSGFKSFRQQHYFPIRWLRVCNTLSTAEDMERMFSTSRARQVRRGLKSGAVVKEAETAEEVNEFAEMLRKNYSSKIRRHFPDTKFFRLMSRYLISRGQCRIFVVVHKDKVIGGSVCIYSADRAYLWFSGGMKKTHPKQYPGVLAIWKALTYAREHGYRQLEFVDVGLPFRRHGYREFVLRFGGEQYSTLRWFHLRYNWMNKILYKVYK